MRTKWTYEMISEEAKKYETRWEFQKVNSGAYKAARKRGILDEVCAHMKYVHTHLYIVKILHPHIDNLYKIGVSNNPKRRVKEFRIRSPFNATGDIISVETDMCVQYEKEILEMVDPYHFEEKFKGISEIRQFDDETLKFILKKYFGVDKYE